MIRDKYRIDAFIATGSMASVYAATHRNGSRVALKILHKDLARDSGMAERFRREGYFANAIGHPGVVRAIDDDVTEDGCVFIVLELLEGENLEERRQRLGGKIPLAEVLQIADSMLDVLSAAHDHEVLHRDMKPENVYVTRKNEVKLLDFGVARFNDGRTSSDMTAVGMVLGTPAFMPPEQAMGRREEVDVRSDIWGVGATLFTVLTGESVHIGGDAKTKLIATARTPARPIRDVLPEIPRAVASVIDRALAFDKVERWVDAKAMREALRWARMTVEGKHDDSMDRPTIDPIPPPVPTRREAPSEPTIAARARIEEFDDSTKKRFPIAEASAPRRKTESIDGVYTSAPPVTQRAEPPSMAMSEGPTFSLRNEPVFSLRRSPSEENPSAAPTPKRVEAAPITERLPTFEKIPAADKPRSKIISDHDVETMARPIADEPPPAPRRDDQKQLAETTPGADAAEIFRLALAEAAQGSDIITNPRALAPETATAFDKPRPAAGMPPEGQEAAPHAGPGGASPNFPLQDLRPTQQTNLGLGPERRGSDRPMGRVGETTAAMPATYTGPPPPYGYPSSAPPPAFPPHHAVPTYPPVDPAAMASMMGGAMPPDYSSGPETGPISPRSIARPSFTPEDPGPLLATIAPKKRSSFVRVFIPIMIGVLAGVVTYVLVVRQRAANASRSAPPVATAEPSAASATPSASAPPSASVSASASAIPSASTKVSSAPDAGSATSASAIASASAAPPHKRKKKPKPPTTATATTPTAEAPTAEPTPTPSPAPTPNDTLPRKEDN